MISEGLKLEPEEYIPTSCDKTCDQSHTVEVEDLGPDLEEDIEFQNSYTDNDKPNLGKSDQPTSSEEDDGSWILKLIDLSGLEKWSEDDKNAAIEMIKRNANVKLLQPSPVVLLVFMNVRLCLLELLMHLLHFKDSCIIA